MSDPAAEAKIQQYERELAKASEAHDPAPFGKYLDDNIVGRGPGWKTSGKAETMNGIKTDTCTTRDAQMSDFAPHWISRDVVLVTYTDSATRTCGGKTEEIRTFSSSLWHRTGDRWTTAFHQETLLQPENGTTSQP